MPKIVATPRHKTYYTALKNLRRNRELCGLLGLPAWDGSGDDGGDGLVALSRILDVYARAEPRRSVREALRSGDHAAVRRVAVQLRGPLSVLLNIGRDLSEAEEALQRETSLLITRHAWLLGDVNEWRPLATALALWFRSVLGRSGRSPFEPRSHAAHGRLLKLRDNLRKEFPSLGTARDVNAAAALFGAVVGVLAIRPGKSPQELDRMVRGWEKRRRSGPGAGAGPKPRRHT